MATIIIDVTQADIDSGIPMAADRPRGGMFPVCRRLTAEKPCPECGRGTMRPIPQMYGATMENGIAYRFQRTRCDVCRAIGENRTDHNAYEHWNRGIPDMGHCDECG